MDQLASALVVIGVLGFIALIFKWIGMGKHADNQRVFETQKQILDKLGSGPDVIQFIESKEGKEFFERLKASVAPAPASAIPKKSQSARHLSNIITNLGFGLFAGGGGVGFLVASLFYKGFPLFVIGFVATGVGIGLLIVSWIYYRLALKWGIIRKETAD